MCSLLSRWLTTLDQAHDCRMQSLWRRWPLGQVGLTTTGYRRSLNCGGAGGQVFTSSPPQGSLSDPAPTPSTCAPPANAQFSTLRLPTLPALDCCLQVWIRRSQITLVHPPPPLCHPLTTRVRS